MRDGEIRLYDVLRVRQWDDMAEEFGMRFGAISVSPNTDFNSTMRYMCGSVFTVAAILPEPESDDCYYRSFEGVENDRDGYDHWYITAGMLEPYHNEDEDDIELPPTEPDGLFSFLGI